MKKISYQHVIQDHTVIRVTRVLDYQLNTFVTDTLITYLENIAQVFGEQRRRQACLNFIIPLNALVNRSTLENENNWCKGLSQDHRGIVGKASDNGRLYKVTFALNNLATIFNFATQGQGLFNGLLVALNTHFAMQGTVQSTLFQGISNTAYNGSVGLL